MRVIDIEEPRARVERLKFFHEAEAYGQDVAPQLTAPFSIGKDPSSIFPAIFLDSTLIAVCNLADTPKLWIRDEYPERYDAALLRAIRNAADVCDEIGRIKRAEAKDKGGASGLFTKTPQAFRPRIQNKKTLHKALLGASVLNQKLRLTWFNAAAHWGDHFMITSVAGKTKYNYNLSVGADGSITYIPDAQPFGLREDVFNTLMDAGLELFETRFNPDTFSEACRNLIETSAAVDTRSIQDAFRAYEHEDISTVVSRYGVFSSKRSDYVTSHRYQGITFAAGSHADICMLYPDLDAEVVRAVIPILDDRWQIAVLGKSPEDFPPLTEALITDRVESTDFGYN